MKRIILLISILLMTSVFLIVVSIIKDQSKTPTQPAPTTIERPTPSPSIIFRNQGEAVPNDFNVPEATTGTITQ